MLAVFYPIDLDLVPEIQDDRQSQETETETVEIEQQSDLKEEANALIQSVVEALRGYSLSVTPKDFVIGPRFIQLQIEPQGKTTVSQIKNRREDLFVKMNLKAPPLISSSQGFVAIEVERAQPDIVRLDDSRFKDTAENLKQAMLLSIGFGCSRSGSMDRSRRFEQLSRLNWRDNRIGEKCFHPIRHFLLTNKLYAK